MTLETKKSVFFVELGKFLSQFSEDNTIKKTVLHNDLF
jgi:hypothetical protein